MRFASYDIVFQEVPDEVSLALNITACPNRCPGCHSPHLWEDAGIELTTDALETLLTDYGQLITCIAFMGGDGALQDLYDLAAWVHLHGYKTAWYSGRQQIPDSCPQEVFDYIKIGPYIEELGGLKSPTTNQRMYKRQDGSLVDITYRFQRK